MIRLIAKNPFRILGVFSNASAKDILSNINKARAFIKVGKPVIFPFDIDLSQFNHEGDNNINRDEATIKSADQGIEFPAERLKAWMFWFEHKTHVDTIAFNHISAGNFDTALDIWKKVENVSSLHNRMVIYLLKQDWYNASITAETLFDNYAADICTSIDPTLQLDSNDLLNLFFSSLALDDYSILSQLYDDLKHYGIQNDDKKWISVFKQIYANREIEELSKSLDISKNADRKNSELMRSCAESYLKDQRLHIIRELIGNDNPEYLAIAHKIASEAIRCVIDFYNNSRDQDDSAEDSLFLLKKILEIASINSLAYQRCKENLEIIQRIVDKLPPKAVRYYHELLQARINRYETEPASIAGATQYLKDCAPYLMSIKAVLGENNEYYIKMSTQVASAILNDVIEDYNKQYKNLLSHLNESTWHYSSNRSRQLYNLTKSAAIIMYQLQCLGLEPEFKEKRFLPNYNTIKDHAEKAKLYPLDDIMFVYSFEDAIKSYALDSRDESGYFKSCSSISECYEYLRIFPSGKYTDQVMQKLEEMEYHACSSLQELEKFISKYPHTCFDVVSKREEVIYNSASSIDDLREYLAKYPNARYRVQALRRIDDMSFKSCKTRLEFSRYLSDFPDGAHRLEAFSKIDDIDYNNCKTIIDLEKYLKDFPNGAHSNQAKDRIEEERFWEECTKKDSWKLYQEYVRRYPKGKYISMAKPNAISPWHKFKIWCNDYKAELIVLLILVGSIILLGLLFGLLVISRVLFIATPICILYGLFGIANAGAKLGYKLGSIIGGLLCLFIGAYLIKLDDKLKEEKEANLALEKFNSALERLNDNPTITDYGKVIQNSLYHTLDSAQKEDIEKKYYQASIDSCYTNLEYYSSGYSGSRMSGLAYIDHFLSDCTNPRYKAEAKRVHNGIVDSLYNHALKTNTYDGWEAYRRSVSSDDYKDSAKKLEETDLSWATESNAWQTASQIDNLSSYEKYLSLFPKGKHRWQADKRIIDLTVDETFAGDHGNLPEMDQVGYGGGSTSYIEVKNNTEYTLTLLYSGVESKRLVLSPYRSSSVTLRNGTYRIAASVSASYVRNYAGSETLKGGSYSVEYYIYTTTSYSKY